MFSKIHKIYLYLFKDKSVAKFGFYSGLIGFLVINFYIDLDSSNVIVTRMFSVAFIMTIWWITEAVPFAVTSLLPIICYPFLGIMSGKSVAASYMNYIIFLFIGGFLLAKAIERWKLHRRISLKTILLFGKSPQMLILGFMVASAFLSMWISNTATCMMMFPIAMAIVDKVESEAVNISRNFSISLYISIAYACTIGGIATPVGTPPNLVFFQNYEALFPDLEPIIFSDWLLMALPISIFMLGLAWITLVYIIFPVKEGYELNLDNLKKEYLALQKPSFEEWVVLVAFLLVSFAWIFRNDIDLGFLRIPGWSNIMVFKDYLDDATVVILAIVLLFIIPSKNEKGQHILHKSTINELPWHIILFFGGGFALASGMISSGLSEYIANQFTQFDNVNLFVFMLILAISVSLLTEITSNLASSQMLLPILASVAIALGLEPIKILFLTTIATSLAFMLPVATPPNTIIFGTGKVKIFDMVRGGVVLNFAGAFFLTIFVYYFLEF